MPTDSASSWTSVKDFLESSGRRAVVHFQRTQWDQLYLIASNSNRHLPCVALDQVTSGANNIVRLLQFSDGSRWVARVPIKGNTELEPEVATMQYIKEYSGLAVPKVFTYALHEENLTGSTYILIEVLHGIVTMDVLSGHKVYRGVIPVKYRQHFYRLVVVYYISLRPSSIRLGAYIYQFQMTSLRLPKISTIVRNREGGYESGPLLGIGGPFDTTAAFFEAWADSIEFKRDDKTIEAMIQRSDVPTERMISIINKFPSQIKAMANRLSTSNNRPFPLCHDDFLHSNIMVDENFNVTGIIDWEGACTVCPGSWLPFPNFFRPCPLPSTFLKIMTLMGSLLTKDRGRHGVRGEIILKW